MTNDIIIDDLLLSIDEQEYIKNTLENENFSWYLSFDKTATTSVSWTDYFSTLTDNISEYLQFVHLFAVNGEKNSEYVNNVTEVFLRAGKKYGFDDSIIRIKGNFCTRVSEQPINSHQSPHIDSNVNHWVMIYYVNDSDGDTIIFNEKLEHPHTMESIKSLTIKKKITPKQGRIVIFDGSYLHAGTHPRSSNSRIVINYVFPKNIFKSG